MWIVQWLMMSYGGGKSFPKTWLVSYYKLDNNANDAHGSNNGTLQGPTYTASGKINGAYDFDGSNDRIKIPNPSLNMASAYTLGAWIKIDAIGGEQGIIVRDKYYDAAQERVFQFRVDSDGKIRLIRFISGGNIQAVSADAISTGAWYFVVATFDNSVGSKIYINGSQNGTTQTTTTNNVNGTNSDVYLGAMENSNVYPYIDHFLNGIIDEVGIWSRALTSDEITQLYNNGNGLAYS